MYERDAAGAAAVATLASDELTLAQDLFVIPDGERYLLYAPLTLSVVSVNRAAARRLERVKQGHQGLDGLAPPFLSELLDAGILVRRDQPRRIAFGKKEGYDPDSLTLFLTTKCTLACTYCYAHGGERPKMMSWETAKAGLDFLFRHAQSKGKERVFLYFHGGGEVTVAWKLVERCVAYARAEAEKRRIAVFVNAGLNGVMAGPLLEWVIGNIDAATVSLDGLPEIHNAQRPLVTGKDSFEVVAAALRRMDEVGFNYGLRTTVTRLSLERMVESVEFMCQSFRAGVIQLEPVFQAGRALANDLLSPDPHEFVRHFRAAREIARAHGRELRYSGARFGTVTNKFCQVSDDQLAITPEGFLSSCYEVGEADDPLANTFFYGRLNPETRELELDMKKLVVLRTLTVEHKSSCDECFCKWSCGGECSAKLARAGNAWDAAESPRCIINRELTLDQIKDYLARGGGPLVPQLGGAAY